MPIHTFSLTSSLDKKKKKVHFCVAPPPEAPAIFFYTVNDSNSHIQSFVFGYLLYPPAYFRCLADIFENMKLAVHEDAPAADMSVLQQECWRQSENWMKREGILDGINIVKQSWGQNEECHRCVRLTLMPRRLDLELFVSLEHNKPARPTF